MCAGEVDAIISHDVEPGLVDRDPLLTRLFPDFGGIEREYYLSTAIHPAMHCVVMRSEIAQRHPWVAERLYDSFSSAREAALTALYDTGAYATMLPFVPAALEEVCSLFGENYWPYGVERNRRMLQQLAAYAFEQGVASSIVAPDTLFPLQLGR